MLGPEALSHIDSAKSPPSFPNCRQPSSLRSMYCSSTIRKTVEEPKPLGVLMIPEDCVSMELPAVNSTPLHPVMVGSSRTAGQETVVVVVLSVVVLPVVVLSVVFEPSSLLQECKDFTWRVPDCDELVGVTHRR